MKRKIAFIVVVLPFILVTDWVSKRWALDVLANGNRMEVLGIPLTLAFNRGAAFGISIGDDPRWFFIPVTVIALVLLGALMVQARKDDYVRLSALSLVIAGALGNLVDRVRWDRGVVDFIGPVDLGFMDWPIFNVADMAISTGAVLLAISFWFEPEGYAETPSRAGSERQGDVEVADLEEPGSA